MYKHVISRLPSKTNQNEPINWKVEFLKNGILCERSETVDGMKEPAVSRDTYLSIAKWL